MAIDRKFIINRYFIIVIVLTLVGLGVVVKASITMLFERDYWTIVANRLVGSTKTLFPTRGNIISADGKLMASSIPEYKIFMDFKVYEKDSVLRAKEQLKRDTLFRKNLDSMCIGLHKLFPDKSIKYFRKVLTDGKKAKSRNTLIYPRRITYEQYKAVRQLPFLRLSKYISGLREELYTKRKNPFGSLANSTLGYLFPDTSLGARDGLELAYDSILAGKSGKYHNQKVLNKFLPIVDVKPEDGCDLVTSIDVDMQDICEKALVDKLKEIGAENGVVVLMETATGNVKAIVNMKLCKDGIFREVQNSAISDLMEPGSTFKTASMMVALEDGKVTPTTEVNTYNGQKLMHGLVMTDHNANKGGYGVIDATHVMMYSSNIGVSSIIDKAYAKNPQKYFDGLRRLGIMERLRIPLKGAEEVRIREPKDYKYYAPANLPWTSIGYVSQIPPINILTFYNAIANNGVMVRPKFVIEALKDGEVVKEFPTEVIKKQICSPRTLKEIREILRRVVYDGLGKPASSTQFSISGKTGTAQISKGKSGYKAGGKEYLVSFCGYFPTEAPRYTCIVSIKRPTIGYASGGMMSGTVFKKIAERVYAKYLHLPLANAVDTVNVLTPWVKAGNLNETKLVLDALKIPNLAKFSFNMDRQTWGSTRTTTRQVELNSRSDLRNYVPDVTDMGAKDAVFLLQKRGLKVRLSGIGSVKSQSIAAGTRVMKGATILLTLGQK